MAESLTTRFGLKRWTADTDTPERADFDAAHNALATNAAGWLPDDTLANRPAAAAANARFLYRATDTGLVYYSTGSAWLELGSEQIAVQTTAPTSPDIGELWLDTDDDSIAVTTSHNALGDLTTGDPHTQYANLDGSRAFTGEVAGVTPTVGASLATKGYVDSAPQGVLERAEDTTGQAGITGTTDLTGLSVDVSLANSRVVRVTGMVRIIGQGAGDRIIVRIVADGSDIAVIGDHNVSGSNSRESFYGGLVLTAPAGVTTFKLTFQKIGTAGSTGTEGSASGPNQIVVEDLGSP